MSKGWYGNKIQHGLASKGIRTKASGIDSNSVYFCSECGNRSFVLSGRVDGTKYECTKCGNWDVIDDPNYEG